MLRAGDEPGFSKLKGFPAQSPRGFKIKSITGRKGPKAPSQSKMVRLLYTILGSHERAESVFKEIHIAKAHAGCDGIEELLSPTIHPTQTSTLRMRRKPRTLSPQSDVPAWTIHACLAHAHQRRTTRRPFSIAKTKVIVQIDKLGIEDVFYHEIL